MLRHKGVFGDMKAVDRSKEELAVLRRYPDAVPVEFRRGGDFDKVIEVVRKNRFVEVRAAVGAGKSTDIPLKLSKALNCLVIHTIPFDIAAHFLADYLIGRDNDGDKFVYMDDLESDMPAHGVVLMSNAFFHARRAYDAFRGVRDAILYLDESHESDGWTASLRTLAPAMKSFRVVKATATAAPGMQMAPDLPSKREILTYPKVPVTTWSAYDRGMPWSAAGIQTNVIICLDRKSTRDKLISEYAEYGFTVRDCTGDRDYSYFSETSRMLNDRNEGIIIVFVDYRYRSSLSILGTREFIDSCEVAVPTVQDGAPKIVYRIAYDFEVQQFLGRGARIPGMPARLWRSAEPSPKMMCDLESLECDAANLLYRMMGFRPPLELVTYPYFKGDVPMDIAAAMASSHPLRLYPEEHRVPWVNGHIALEQEKEKAAYEYEITKNRMRKAVSCHTVVDAERPRTPPPPVPVRYRSTKVDVDGLDEYRSSRDSSPSAVFTLDTDVYDNLSAAIDASAVRPKRIAKRVLEARAAEAAALEFERLQADRMSQVSAKTEEVPVALQDRDDQVVAFQQAADKPTELIRQHTVLAKGSAATGVEHRREPVDFDRDVGGMLPVYDALLSRERHGPDITLGKYYHYHNMDSAPKFSTTFLRGVDSVVSYCEHRDASRYVKGLSDADKLYAMRSLVDAANHATAVAMGMQRLFREVSGRPPEEWRDIVDPSAMMTEVEWMLARCSEEQAKVRIFHGLIPLFAVYALDEISAPLELEQRVMLAVMERIERVAVKKDPEKSLDYWQHLNGRNVALTPRRDSRSRRNGIQFH